MNPDIYDLGHGFLENGPMGSRAFRSPRPRWLRVLNARDMEASHPHSVEHIAYANRSRELRLMVRVWRLPGPTRKEIYR